MRFEGHVLSAVPFALAGEWAVAVGCLLPDLTWIANEWTIRRSPLTPLETIDRLSEWRLLPYRAAHSLLLWAMLVLIAPSTASLVLGVAVHVILDLPTHRGRMLQRPVWPIPWSWKWVL